MTLIGVAKVGDSRTETIDLWKQFDVVEPRVFDRFAKTRYVVITYTMETDLMFKHHLFVGTEVMSVKAPPLGAIVKLMPAAQYGIFSAWTREYDLLWRHVMEDWILRSPYEMPGFVIQRFDQQRYFDARPGQREIDLLLPLREKKPAG
jgi:predicted transcriptional regulator YdeE